MCHHEVPAIFQQVVKDKYVQSASYHNVWYFEHQLIEFMLGTHESAFQRFSSLIIGLCHSYIGFIYDYEWKGALMEDSAIFGQ